MPRYWRYLLAALVDLGAGAILRGTIGVIIGVFVALTIILIIESRTQRARRRYGSTGQRARLSPDRVGLGLRATGPRKAEDQSKGLLRAGPELADHRFAARSDEVTQDERDDDRIVELSSHRDEVRDEVEGQSEVADEGDQQQLATSWHAWIACKARHEHDAVRNERGKRTRILAAAAYHEPRDQ
jgi:hypothetical protein